VRLQNKGEVAGVILRFNACSDSEQMVKIFVHLRRLSQN